MLQTTDRHTDDDIVNVNVIADSEKIRQLIMRICCFICLTQRITDC